MASSSSWSLLRTDFIVLSPSLSPSLRPTLRDETPPLFVARGQFQGRGSFARVECNANAWPLAMPCECDAVQGREIRVYPTQPASLRSALSSGHGQGPLGDPNWRIFPAAQSYPTSSNFSVSSHLFHSAFGSLEMGSHFPTA